MTSPVGIQDATSGAGRAGAAMFRTVTTLGSFVAGAFLLVVAQGWIPGLAPTPAAGGAVGADAAAAFLFACGIFAWVFFARFVSGAAAQILLAPTGLVATTFRGATVDLRWSDPKLELVLMVSASDPEASVFLSAGGRGGRFTGRVTREGRAELESEAQRQGLRAIRPPSSGAALTYRVTLRRP